MKNTITLEELNLELYYLGFNSNKKGFGNSDLENFNYSEFETVEDWYLDRIK